MKNSKRLWKSLFVAALSLSGCTTIPDIEVCTPTDQFPGVAALCRNTNSDHKRRLSPGEFFDFIYAQKERPDPKNPSKKLPEKGPAIFISSEDYRRNDTALGQLCTHAPCSYEVKKSIEKASTQVNTLLNEATVKQEK